MYRAAQGPVFIPDHLPEMHAGQEERYDSVQNSVGFSALLAQALFGGNTTVYGPTFHFNDANEKNAKRKESSATAFEEVASHLKKYGIQVKCCTNHGWHNTFRGMAGTDPGVPEAYGYVQHSTVEKRVNQKCFGYCGRWKKMF